MKLIKSIELRKEADRIRERLNELSEECEAGQKLTVEDLQDVIFDLIDFGVNRYEELEEEE